MHFRRLASLILGGWLAGSLLALAFAAKNLGIVDELVRTPAKEAVDVMVKLQESEIRTLMNYHGEMVNRWVWRTWESAQFVLGAVLLMSLFFSIGGKRYTMILCLMMIASTAFQHWFLTPKVDQLTQATVFVKPDQLSVERDRLRSVQAGYSTTEALKVTIGILLAWGLLKRGRRRQRDSDVE
jgi:hypothetical protein